jgi:DNA gyrase/topoisomerase IV subunit B
MADNKEIVALGEREHLLLRPTIYVGSVTPSEEKIPVIRDGRIFFESKVMSVGFYKLFLEILDNAIDEAKRMNGKMKTITVKVDSSSGLVEVEDTGGGFYKGIVKNKVTGVTNIETAVSQLRAGSNFYNENVDESLIGTNGVGAALVNMLSKRFYIETKNKESYFYKEWDDFVPVKEDIRKGTQLSTGTKVGFIPLKSVFRGCKWEKDIIHTMLVLRNFIIKETEDKIKNLEIVAYFDGAKLDLSLPFIPKDAFVCRTPLGLLAIYETFQGAGSVSFVNSAMCTGMHQRIINDNINDQLGDTLGHHFYETILLLNLPPKLVKFGDQNKTKFVSTRAEVEGTILHHFKKKLHQFYGTPLFDRIKQRVDERSMSAAVNKLRSAKKKSDARNSAKFFPPTQAVNLFIVEGNSARGSILQKRNTKTDGVYTLKGKIKNARSVADLTDNQEIVELMQILDLDLDPAKRNFSYNRVIISTDFDNDGFHIASLLINLFHKWFSYVIEEGRLFIFKVPLVSVDEKGSRRYFYDLATFKEYAKNKTPRDVRYLKGLGSMDERDWEFAMGDRQLLQVKKDSEAHAYMSMAFDSDPLPRKKWLRGEFKTKSNVRKK